MNGEELGWRRECADADALLRHLGLNPEQCRTDGGWLNLPRIKTLLAEQPSVAPAAPARVACPHCGYAAGDEVLGDGITPAQGEQPAWVDPDTGEQRVTPRPAPHKRPPPMAKRESSLQLNRRKA